METWLKKAKPASIEDTIFNNSIELRDTTDLGVLIEKIGDARYVLLGEASHGTHEYYTWRAAITKKLIEEHGFSFVAVEGDWPDCYRINRYVKDYSHEHKDAFAVLKKFNRWPTWMWANWEVAAFTEWLRLHNQQHPKKKVGFYGLDVYSLWESFESIIEYLRKEDPAAMQMAMKALNCFEPYGRDEGISYARANFMVPSICEDDVVKLLVHVRKKMRMYDTDKEGAMNAEQNAQILVEAEKYYRSMLYAGPDSWNIRDRHMTATLNRLMKFHGAKAKAIVWEHNTHIGNASATNMTDEGMINLGQLISEEHHDAGVFAVGFGSYRGSVIAAKGWGEEMQVMQVPKARAGTWEFLLHQFHSKDRIVLMTEGVKKKFGDIHLGHRAIGVVYDPEHDFPGNYVPSRMADRYQAFIFIDKTSALHPIYTTTLRHELPETYPFGI